MQRLGAQVLDLDRVERARDDLQPEQVPTMADAEGRLLPPAIPWAELEVVDERQGSKMLECGLS